MKLKTNLILRRRNALCLVLGLAIAGVGGVAFRQHISHRRAQQADLDRVVTATVTTGPFDHVILELGVIESGTNDYVVCEVPAGKSGTRILWVIEDGSIVREGDLLLELDSSAMETALTAQRIIVSGARAAMIEARADLEAARIAVPQYLEGTFLSQRKTVQSQIAKTQQDVRTAELRLASEQRLSEKGSINQLQTEAAQYAVANARNALESDNQRLWILDHLTKKKNKVHLETRVEAAEAKYHARRKVLQKRVERLEQLEDYIAKCSIRSQSDGVVIYNNLDEKKAGKQFVVEEGAYVRERQAILKLPDLSHLQVKAQFNETRIMEIREGAPAKIRVDALPALEMAGRVETVKKWAKRDKYGSFVREYTTYIDIHDPSPTVQIGMTAEVQVYVDHFPNAIQVAIESVHEHEGHLFCLRQVDDDAWETVEIEIGATSETMAVVQSGLADGDIVAINPRHHGELLDLPTIDPIPNRQMFVEIGAAAPSTPTVSLGVKKDKPPGRAGRAVKAGDAKSRGKAGQSASRGKRKKRPDAMPAD